MGDRYTPEANAAIEQLQAAGFDYAEADMIYHGDFLGSALGAKTATLITSLRGALEAEKRTSRGDWATQRELDALTINFYAMKTRAETVEREKDEAVRWIGVVREELSAAGFPPGDRDVALVSIRSLLNPSRKETGI